MHAPLPGPSTLRVVIDPIDYARVFAAPQWPVSCPACWTCGKVVGALALQLCRRCFGAQYCSPECATAAWGTPGTLDPCGQNHWAVCCTREVSGDMARAVFIEGGGYLRPVVTPEAGRGLVAAVDLPEGFSLLMDAVTVQESGVSSTALRVLPTLVPGLDTLAGTVLPASLRDLLGTTPLTPQARVRAILNRVVKVPTGDPKTTALCTTVALLNHSCTRDNVSVYCVAASDTLAKTTLAPAVLEQVFRQRAGGDAVAAGVLAKMVPPGPPAPGSTRVPARPPVGPSGAVPTLGKLTTVPRQALHRVVPEGGGGSGGDPGPAGAGGPAGSLLPTGPTQWQQDPEAVPEFEVGFKDGLRARCRRVIPHGLFRATALGPVGPAHGTLAGAGDPQGVPTDLPGVVLTGPQWATLHFMAARGMDPGEALRIVVVPDVVVAAAVAAAAPPGAPVTWADLHVDPTKFGLGSAQVAVTTLRPLPRGTLLVACYTLGQSDDAACARLLREVHDLPCTCAPGRVRVVDATALAAASELFALVGMSLSVPQVHVNTIATAVAMVVVADQNVDPDKMRAWEADLVRVSGPMRHVLHVPGFRHQVEQVVAYLLSQVHPQGVLSLRLGVARNNAPAMLAMPRAPPAGCGTSGRGGGCGGGYDDSDRDDTDAQAHGYLSQTNTEDSSAGEDSPRPAGDEVEAPAPT